MFFEIIRFAMAPGIPDDEKERCFDVLREMSRIDVVLSVFIGQDFGHGGQSSEGFTHSVIVTIPGEQFYRAYQRHRQCREVLSYVMPRLLKWQVINIGERVDESLRARLLTVSHGAWPAGA